jgi:ABC-2 type transport system permease protein
LELLLANPVTRLRVVFERYLAAVLLLAAVTGALTISLLAFGPLVGLLDGIRITRLLAAGAAAFCLALLHFTVAFAVGCAAGRPGPAVAVTTSVAAAGYLLQGLAATSKALGPVPNVSPWHWYLDRNILADGLAPGAVLAPILVTGLLLAAGAWLFNRRDLH